MRKTRYTSHTFNYPKRQTGAALLLFILLLVVGASTLLVSKLNKAASKAYWENYTGERLMEAKAALLGRTASDNNRPGSLPCPDVDGDGVTDTNFGNCTSYTGFFPWKTLDIEELKDGSNSPLWYSLQQTLRDHNSAEPINSEIPGELTVDNGTGTGFSDLVAVIIAPGEAFPSQDRAINPNLASSYLEQENNDGDQDFISYAPSGDFNDTIVSITRQELMAVAEKRVLGQYTNILNAYKRTYGGYPWLSRFGDPTSSTFNSELNVLEGHLPIHIKDQVFKTSFTVDWNMSSGTTPAPFGNVTSDLLNGIGVGSIVFDQRSSIYGSTTGSSECLWKSKDTVSCKGAATENLAGGFTRIYDIDISFTKGVVSINSPDLSKLRTRDVQNLFGSASDTKIKITIRDNSSGIEETGTNLIGNNSIGTFIVSAINYNLDPVLDPVTGLAEVPVWITRNKWHHLIYIAYSDGYKPGSTSNCIPGLDCLSLNNTIPVNNKMGVVISAGIDISGARSTNPGAWNNYFEDSVHILPPNANDIFEKRAITVGYNDQVRILGTEP